MISRKQWMLAALLWIGCCIPAFAAQEQVRWTADLDTARQIAARNGRLILVHFYGNGCPPCAMMEREVFPDPLVVDTIQRDFVPVKIKVDDSREIASQFGVKQVPADVIMTPYGRVLSSTVGAAKPVDYTTQLSKVSAQWYRMSRAMQQTQPPQVAATQPGPPVQGYESGYSRYDNQPSQQTPDPTTNYQASGYQQNRYTQQPPADYSASQPQYASQPYGNQYAQNQPPVDRSMQQQTPVANQPAQSQPAQGGNPALGLDGYCPVRLTETERWVPGNPRFGARHRGCTYLFAGPEEQKRFFDNPDRYAPVASGNDVVLLIDQNHPIPGQRQFGVWYLGRVYLFSNQDTCRHFGQDPERYVGAIARLEQGNQQPPQQEASRRPVTQF